MPNDNSRRIRSLPSMEDIFGFSNVPADKTAAKLPDMPKGDLLLESGWEEEKRVKSPTLDEVIGIICEEVEKNTMHGKDENCSDFMLPYERNTEPYRYDKANSLYSPQFLDLPDAPVSPEDVEAKFQNILAPYGIRYVRPKIRYVAEYEPGYPNGVESFNWTYREANEKLAFEMSKYIVENFLYEEDIPLTTYPNTEITMHLDANRYPDLEILTHEFKHAVDLPLLQNLSYIYGLNEFRKLDWALRAVRGKDWCWSNLNGKLDTWIKANNFLLDARLKNMQGRLDFMENENTLGQHRYSNIPLLKEVYDEYLSKILMP